MPGLEHPVRKSSAHCAPHWCTPRPSSGRRARSPRAAKLAAMSDGVASGDVFVKKLLLIWRRTQAGRNDPVVNLMLTDNALDIAVG